MNKIKLLVAPFILVSFLVSCGGNPAPVAETYIVSLGETSGVTITPPTAKKGEDYIGTIAVNTDTIDEGLPETLSKVTVGGKELTSADYTYTAREDRLSADFIIPKTNVNGDIVISLKLVNFKIDSQEEYENAMLMKNVSYLQANGEEKGKFWEQYSPNVCHMHNIREKEGEVIDKEQYIERVDEKTCWLYTKEDEKWIKTSVESTNFTTIEDFVRQNNFDEMIDEYPYSALSYKNGNYFVHKSDDNGTTTFTLRFLDKRLVYRDILTDEMHEYFNLAYEEKTPDLPDVPSSLQ